MREEPKRIHGNKNRQRPRDTLFYGALDSPVGTVYVAFDGKNVRALSFSSKSERDFCTELSSRTSMPVSRSDILAKPIVEELREYFEGKRKNFSFSFDLSGFTDFQKRVLNAAARIRYGQTRTYGWLAGQADSPKAARAVGQVMARNPIPIIIPCHRVIGSSGKLCGFGGGLRALDLKRKLLELEGIEVQESIAG